MAAEYLFCAMSDFASPSSAGTDLGSVFSATLNSSMAASSWFNWLSATPNAMWPRGFSGFNRVAIRSSRAARRGLVALQQSERQVEVGFPGIGIQMHGRFKSGNRARYLLPLPKIRAQRVVGTRRRMRLDRLFQFRRALACGSHPAPPGSGYIRRNKRGRKREPTSPRAKFHPTIHDSQKWSTVCNRSRTEVLPSIEWTGLP